MNDKIKYILLTKCMCHVQTLLINDNLCPPIWFNRFEDRTIYFYFLVHTNALTNRLCSQFLVMYIRNSPFWANTGVVNRLESCSSLG